MSSNQVTFQTSLSYEQIELISNVLKTREISHKIVENKPVVDHSFANNQIETVFHIQLAPEDFDAAEQALSEELAPVDTIEDDHYLHSFSIEELKEIIEKADEWSLADVQLARGLLKEKGIHYTDEELLTIKEKRYEELAKPEQHKVFTFAMIVVLLVFHAFTGVIGGWYFISSKKTLPNGQQVHMYDENTRKRGLYLLLIGIVLTILYLGGYFVIEWVLMV